VIHGLVFEVLWGKEIFMRLVWALILALFFVPLAGAQDGNSSANEPAELPPQWRQGTGLTDDDRAKTAKYVDDIMSNSTSFSSELPDKQKPSNDGGPDQ
jgi:hypothetical protein